jgi:hypothetical protein
MNFSARCDPRLSFPRAKDLKTRRLLPLNAGKFEVLFRLNRPEKPLFAKTWVLGILRSKLSERRVLESRRRGEKT